MATPESAIRYVCIDEVDGDPFNVRTKLTGIATLADSIERYGLLENLVAIEIPTEAREPGAPWLELRAGSRRYEAIVQLKKSGRWSESKKVPVLIIDSDGMWENMVENIQRVAVTPWDVGRRLSELSAAGMSNREIGERLGHSNGWVSRYITIGLGLHPETIEYLSRRKLKLSVGDLFRIAGIVDKSGEPDSEKQIAAMARHKKRRPRRFTADNVRAFGMRLSYMRSQMPVPHLVRPIVEAVLDYIEGGGKPNLKNLELDLLQAKSEFLKEEDD